MREHNKLRDLERLNAAQGARCRNAEARLAQALLDARGRRDAHDRANTAFEDSLEDCRRAMSGHTLDPALIEMVARTPPLLAQQLSEARAALTAAEGAAYRAGVQHAEASVRARNAQKLERKSRRRLARKLEERALAAHEDVFALKSATS
jgi:hypothetical protein